MIETKKIVGFPPPGRGIGMIDTKLIVDFPATEYGGRTELMQAIFPLSGGVN